jgi:hypothetical protein
MKFDRFEPLLADVRTAVGHLPTAIRNGDLDVARDLVSTALARLTVVADILRGAASA